MRALLYCSLLLSPTLVAQEIDRSVPPSDDAVVWQGDQVIDFTTIDARVSRVPANRREGFMDSPKRIEQLLHAMLQVKQLAAHARAAGLDQDPVVQADLQLAQDDILARKYIASRGAALQVPDMVQAARERYTTQPDAFRVPESISVRHILVTHEGHGERTAQSVARELRAKIVEQGRPFDEVAAEAAVAAGIDDGLLEGLTRGESVPAFDKAAFALAEPGEISDVVETRFGFHIIQLVARQEAQRRSFDEVRPTLVAQLEQEYLDRARRDIVESATADLPIHAAPEHVQSLRTRYAPGGPGAQAIGRTADIAGDGSSGTE
jgi:peptidyl-prolyl cis-trans isomerase C